MRLRVLKSANSFSAALSRGYLRGSTAYDSSAPSAQSSPVLTQASKVSASVGGSFKSRATTNASPAKCAARAQSGLRIARHGAHAQSARDTPRAVPRRQRVFRPPRFGTLPSVDAAAGARGARMYAPLNSSMRPWGSTNCGSAAAAAPEANRSSAKKCIAPPLRARMAAAASATRLARARLRLWCDASARSALRRGCQARIVGHKRVQA